MPKTDTKTDDKDQLQKSRQNAKIFAEFVIQAYLMDCKDHTYFRKHFLVSIMNYNSSLSYHAASLIVTILSHLHIVTYICKNKNYKFGSNDVPEDRKSKLDQKMTERTDNLFAWPRKEQDINRLKPKIASIISNCYEDKYEANRPPFVTYDRYEGSYQMPKLSDTDFNSMKDSISQASKYDKTTVQEIKNNRKIHLDDSFLVILAALLIVLPKTIFGVFSFFKYTPIVGMISYRYLCDNLLNYTGPVRIIIFLIAACYVMARRHKIMRLNRDLESYK